LEKVTLAPKKEGYEVHTVVDFWVDAELGLSAFEYGDWECNFFPSSSSPSVSSSKFKLPEIPGRKGNSVKSSQHWFQMEIFETKIVFNFLA
jgi:hypothetical protein